MNRRSPKSFVLTFLFLILAYAGGYGESAWADEAFRKSELSVVSKGAVHRFIVEMAETQAQRTQGLQWRKELAWGIGMLFDFGSTGPVTMWMKNTYVPLDMFFIAADGTIVNIARETEPLSLKYINSAGPVKAVLEVHAGTASRLGIRAGDRVRHAIFSR